MKRKLWFVLAVALALMKASAADDHFLYGLERSFNGATVDLRPLRDWWVRGKGKPMNDPILDESPRPLTSWLRVTGEVVQETNGWWIVNAYVETAPHKGERRKVFVKNPPVEERAAFESAREREKFLAERITTLNGAASLNRDTADGHAGTASVLTAVGNASSSWRVFRDMNVAAYQHSLAASASGQRANAQMSESMALHHELEEVRAFLESFPDRHVYRMDSFALRLPTAGPSVFDVGLVKR